MSHFGTYLLIVSVLSTVMLASIDSNMEQVVGWLDDSKDVNDCVHRCVTANVTANASTTNSQLCNCAFAERHPNSMKKFQEIFDLLTIIMPLFSSFLLAMLHLFDPKLKWLSLKFAAAQVEAEIYKYRLRAGHYENVKVESKWWRMARSGQLKSGALQAAMRSMQEAHKGEARTKFGLQLKMIDADLKDGTSRAKDVPSYCPVTPYRPV
jgi:hypothetical protein